MDKEELIGRLEHLRCKLEETQERIGKIIHRLVMEDETKNKRN